MWRTNGASRSRPVGGPPWLLRGTEAVVGGVGILSLKGVPLAVALKLGSRGATTKEPKPSVTECEQKLLSSSSVRY